MTKEQIKRFEICSDALSKLNEKKEILCAALEACKEHGHRIQLIYDFQTFAPDKMLTEKILNLCLDAVNGQINDVEKEIESI